MASIVATNKKMCNTVNDNIEALRQDNKNNSENLLEGLKSGFKDMLIGIKGIKTYDSDKNFEQKAIKARGEDTSLETIEEENENEDYSYESDEEEVKIKSQSEDDEDLEEINNTEKTDTDESQKTSSKTTVPSMSDDINALPPFKLNNNAIELEEGSE